MLWNSERPTMLILIFKKIEYGLAYKLLYHLNVAMYSFLPLAFCYVKNTCCSVEFFLARRTFTKLWSMGCKVITGFVTPFLSEANFWCSWLWNKTGQVTFLTHQKSHLWSEQKSVVLWGGTVFTVILWTTLIVSICFSYSQQYI